MQISMKISYDKPFERIIPKRLPQSRPNFYWIKFKWKIFIQNSLWKREFIFFFLMNQINFSSNQRQPGKLVMIISNLHGDIEYFACVNERLQGMPKAIRSERGILRGHYRPRNALPPANSCILKIGRASCRERVSSAV